MTPQAYPEIFSRKIFTRDKKRALSTIVTSLLLILLVIIAISIVWIVIRNVLQGGTEGIFLDKFTIDAQIKNVEVNNETNNVSLIVKRNSGDGEISGLKFIFYNETDSEIIEEKTTLEALGSQSFIFNLIMDVDGLTKISIIPVFKTNGKESTGNVLSTYDLSSGTSSGSSSSCTPVADPCGSAECGNVANGTCGQVSCGTCNSGYSCESGTCVVDSTPCNLTSASWSQTDVVEGTLVNLNVAGTNCDGKEISFEVWEDDVLPDQPVTTNPANAVFTGNTVTGTWTAEYQSDISGDPEYYFIASVVGESESITSGQTAELELSVSEAGAVCGDNNLEGTEVCECGLDSAFGTADDDVGVETCELQGYDSGDLYCASGCVGYDAGSCVSDADIIALSCSQEHVQDAINEAVDGDIVQVPVGSCTWSGKVTVDKGITVRGAGIGKTNITNYGFDITDGTDNLRISGFEFNNSILIRGDPCIYVGGYHSSDGVRNFRIDNSRFNDYPTPMLIQGYSTGVIDHNSFYGSSVIFADGIGVWGDNDAAWTRDVGLGTDDFVFLENNIFDNNGDEIGHVVTSSHGGRFVFRYNTIRENGHRILDPVDVHGNGHGSNNRGGMVFEIYENTFIRDSLGMSRAIRLRGGTGVVFNNIFDETVDVYDEHIELTDYRAGKYQPMSPNTCASAEFCPIVDGGEGHPCCDQIGRGRDQVNEPLYTWGNENHNEIAVTPTVPSVVSEYIQVNRDYYVGIEKPGYTPYTYPHPLTQS